MYILKHKHIKNDSKGSAQLVGMPECALFGRCCTGPSQSSQSLMKIPKHLSASDLNLEFSDLADQKGWFCRGWMYRKLRRLDEKIHIATNRILRAGEFCGLHRCCVSRGTLAWKFNLACMKIMISWSGTGHDLWLIAYAYDSKEWTFYDQISILLLLWPRTIEDTVLQRNLITALANSCWKWTILSKSDDCRGRYLLWLIIIMSRHPLLTK